MEVVASSGTAFPRAEVKLEVEVTPDRRPNYSTALLRVRHVDACAFEQRVSAMALLRFFEDGAKHIRARLAAEAAE